MGSAKGNGRNRVEVGRNENTAQGSREDLQAQGEWGLIGRMLPDYPFGAGLSARNQERSHGTRRKEYVTPAAA